MADITSRYQGNVDDSDQVNWRGDQVAAPQGGQSIYDSSSIKLTELGSRKVVGDRVFRYALASGAIGAGDVAESQPETLLLVTGGAANPAGGKQFTWYAATAMSKDTYEDGMLICGSGTAANLGYAYKVKSHPAITATTNGTLTLYDPLKKAVNVTDTWTLQQNMYRNCIECTTGDAHHPVGVAPIAVTSGDYFWLQTWGPAGVKCGAGATGAVCADVTGQVIAYNSTFAQSANAPVGNATMDITASQYGIVYLTIAP
jgi:hypothetical protein